MAEFRSALSSRLVPGRFGAETASPPLTLSEQPLGALFQIAGWPGDFDDAVRPVLAEIWVSDTCQVGQVLEAGEHLVFRVAPERILVRTTDPGARDLVRDRADDEVLALLDLSHARTVFRIEGMASAELLARLASIDLCEDVFPVNSFALTAVHTVPVMLHRVPGDTMGPCYDLFVPYSWAASLWDLVCHTALPFGYEIRAGTSSRNRS